MKAYLIDDENIQHDIIDMHLYVSFGINRITQTSELAQSIQLQSLFFAQ